jgi:chromosome segregation ATPase
MSDIDDVVRALSTGIALVRQMEERVDGVGDLERRVASANERLDACSRRNRNLEDQHRADITRIKELELHINSLCDGLAASEADQKRAVASADAAQVSIQRLTDECDELRGQLNAAESRIAEYEGAVPMQIGPSYQRFFDHLQNVINAQQMVGLPITEGLLGDIRNLLNATRTLDAMSRARFEKVQSLQAALVQAKDHQGRDELIRVENATRRADTAERLMRQAVEEADQLSTQNGFLAAKVEELESAIRKDSLADAIITIGEAMTRVTEALVDAGSGIRAGAEVRRQMAVKYSLEHDAAHGSLVFEDAARALLSADDGIWPRWWGLQKWADLTKDPQDARAHAIALIAVAYDITKREQDDA